ncbi:hypothetical protein BRAO375_2080011 [Bradyrhizobium sp. ORS 375]|nr:hypothetical protein BRAO375_2080011 [Bradyrhizobium sp. ORS 375]
MRFWACRHQRGWDCWSLGRRIRRAARRSRPQFDPYGAPQVRAGPGTGGRGRTGDQRRLSGGDLVTGQRGRGACVLQGAPGQVCCRARSIPAHHQATRFRREGRRQIPRGCRPVRNQAAGQRDVRIVEAGRRPVLPVRQPVSPADSTPTSRACKKMAAEQKRLKAERSKQIAPGLSDVETATAVETQARDTGGSSEKVAAIVTPAPGLHSPTPTSLQLRRLGCLDAAVSGDGDATSARALPAAHANAFSTVSISTRNDLSCRVIGGIARVMSSN